ncbi:MAG: TorF family putative porin [Sulfuricella sp.]
MRKLTQALLLAGVVGMPALMVSTSSMADEAPAASSVTGNMAFVSNYVFRGLTQTWAKPTVQAGLDYVHPSGFYLGTWGSGVSDKEYANASMEWDLYAGYNGKFSDDFGWGVGAIQVTYPGGHANIADKTKYDTTELNAQLTYKFITLKYSYALTNLFGLTDLNFIGDGTGAGIAPTGNTKGSEYLELNASYEVMDKLVLGGHIGHQKVKNCSACSYTDYKISLNKELPKEMFGLNIGLAYTDTNADRNAWSALALNGDSKYLGDKAWTLSVAKTF